MGGGGVMMAKAIEAIQKGLESRKTSMPIHVLQYRVPYITDNDHTGFSTFYQAMLYMVDSRESTAHGVSEGGEKIYSYELVLSCT